MKKILMTGATGFIGRNFIKYNERCKKYQIAACVRNTKIRKLSGVTHVKHWNITDHFELYSSDDFARDEYDVFLHCASIVGNVPNTTFIDHFNTNVIGTINTLKCAHDLEIPNYVYISTGSVYGNTGYFTRNSPCFPTGNYAITKHMGEQACVGVSQECKDIKMSILRIFYPFGNDMQEFRTIPTIFTNVKNGNPILIDYPKPLEINPIHIDDVCDYMGCAVDYGGTGIQNISGKSYLTISDIAHIFADTIGVEPSFNFRRNVQFHAPHEHNAFIGEPWGINIGRTSTESRLRDYAEANK